MIAWNSKPALLSIGFFEYTKSINACAFVSFEVSIFSSIIFNVELPLYILRLIFISSELSVFSLDISIFSSITNLVSP